MNDIDVEYYLNLALIEAEKANKLKEVPIGAIVVNHEKTIIGKGYNKTERESNPIAHAEILAIESAAKQNKDWRLNNFILFSTLEPCEMCLAAAHEARISRIYFGCEANKKNNRNENLIYTNLNNSKCKKIIKNFFKTLR